MSFLRFLFAHFVHYQDHQSVHTTIHYHTIFVSVDSICKHFRFVLVPYQRHCARGVKLDLAWHVIRIILQDAVEGLIQNEAKRKKDDEHTSGTLNAKTVSFTFIFLNLREIRCFPSVQVSWIIEQIFDKINCSNSIINIICKHFLNIRAL